MMVAVEIGLVRDMSLLQFAIGFVRIYESSLGFIIHVYSDIQDLQRQGLFTKITHVYTTTVFEESVMTSATAWYPRDIMGLRSS